jgi:cyanate permease
VVNFCYNYFTFYCMTWMPAYLVEQRGLTLEKMGLYSFFSFAGIAIVALVAGWVADRLIARGGNAVVVRKSFVIAGFVGPDGDPRAPGPKSWQWPCSGTWRRCRAWAWPPPTTWPSAA